MLFRYYQDHDGGIWESEPTEASTDHEIRRGVLAGHLSGVRRWAVTDEGRYVYGLDRTGKPLADPRPPKHLGRPDGCPDCGGGPDGQGGAGFKNGLKCTKCGGSGWEDLKAWQARRDAAK